MNIPCPDGFGESPMAVSAGNNDNHPSSRSTSQHANDNQPHFLRLNPSPKELSRGVYIRPGSGGGTRPRDRPYPAKGRGLRIGGSSAAAGGGKAGGRIGGLEIVAGRQ